jgi:capsular polysaccharide export protein
MMAGRSFLFLQGVATPFFADLGRALQARGHAVRRVNFCGGDLAYAGGLPHWNFRGAAWELRAWLDIHAATEGFTDVVLFGDCRPLHQRAVAWATANALRIHVFEEGYFRPYWVTLERGGVNSNSPLSMDADWYRDVGSRLPDYGDSASFVSPFWLRAVHDVVYHTAGIGNPFLFPSYRTHAPTSAAIEYAAYLRRFAVNAMHRESDLDAVRKVVSAKVPFYFLPLQLDGDAQIRDHSQFDDMSAAMHTVMASFAQYAPIQSRLVIKGHPLDPGLVSYRLEAKMLARHYGLEDRLVYVDAGDLEVLLPNCEGVVTVNSTVGILSLAMGAPTMALSEPIYKLPGLTFDGKLDLFWREHAKPDADLFRCFRNTVMHCAQINGGFYCPQGRALAVANSVPRLEADVSPLETLL